MKSRQVKDLNDVFKSVNNELTHELDQIAEKVEALSQKQIKVYEEQIKELSELTINKLTGYQFQQVLEDEVMSKFGVKLKDVLTTKEVEQMSKRLNEPLFGSFPGHVITSVLSQVEQLASAVTLEVVSTIQAQLRASENISDEEITEIVSLVLDRHLADLI